MVRFVVRRGQSLDQDDRVGVEQGEQAVTADALHQVVPFETVPARCASNASTSVCWAGTSTSRITTSPPCAGSAATVKVKNEQHSVSRAVRSRTMSASPAGPAIRN